MSMIFYPPMDDDPELVAVNPRQSVRESMVSIQHAINAANAQERQIAASMHRIATFRIPIELLKRLDEVAGDAATSRGHLLRQIIADYLAYVDERSIQYRGSLLSAHTPMQMHRSGTISRG